MVRSTTIDALTVTPFVRDWLQSATAVRLLHRFDRACNLVDGRGEVISIVTASIGPGPFAITVPDGVPFLDGDDREQIHINGESLRVGRLVVDVSAARTWQPRPDWAHLQRDLSSWRVSLPQVRKMIGERPLTAGAISAAMQHRWQSAADGLAAALQADDVARIEAAVRTLAGVGDGLTPAGDDVLVGATLALWLCQPRRADLLAQMMAETAAPRTTTLSAAWLRAAARGEADAVWHTLLCQTGSERVAWKTAVWRILERGHASGAAALYGFTAVLSRLLAAQTGKNEVIESFR